ncbi:MULTISPECIES: IclR family transcriptional regulator domain-containing protein [Paenarthrobacter]|nr:MULTISPECIES: IclR family transcriptional regulator C-terminal domain-containing protein [Paenarthrobacter]
MSRGAGGNYVGKPNEAMAGLAKGLAILEGFDKSRPRMTISQAAEFADVSPAAARRCLLTLLDAGYVSHDGKYFQPTPRMVRLGRAYLGTSPLALHAQTYLDQARDVLDEAVSLAVWDEGQCLFVARAGASQIVSTDIAVGVRLPAHASATGRALLSALKEEEEIRSFFQRYPPVQLTPSTITDVDALTHIVQRAGELGYATSAEELELGMHSLAVPVADSRGACVATISVSAFTGRIGIDELVDKALPILRLAAEGLGKTL